MRRGFGESIMPLPTNLSTDSVDNLIVIFITESER